MPSARRDTDRASCTDPTRLRWTRPDGSSVADRQNQRIVIFDQDGNYLNRWTQFGMPSDIVIDDDGRIYVADSESDTTQNPGWEKGIRIGDVETGWVEYFNSGPGRQSPDHRWRERGRVAHGRWER